MNTKERIEKRRAERKRKRVLTILMVAVGAALVLSAAILLLSNTNQVDLARSEIVTPPLEQPPLVNGAGMGDPEAPVTIVDFSDFGCSHCANFAFSTEKQLAAEYVASGEVYFEFRSVGGMLGSSATVQAAEAAYCAADQDMFYPFHDLIFANQRQLFVNRDADLSPTLETFAGILEMDVDQFSECLDSGRYSERVDQDQAAADQADVSGTPSFLVNGQLLVGNQPFANFQQVIEREMAGN